MDKLEKALTRLSREERTSVKQLLQRIITGRLENLNLKKLKGYDDTYRVRKGKIRIIFQKNNGRPIIIAISRRTEAMYRQS